MKENWLTQKPRYSGIFAVFILTFVLFTIAILEATQIYPIYETLKASRTLVFLDHHYLRLWTSLFVHADSGHLFSNLLIFIPLVYLTASYFGSIALPFFAILLGGMVNAVVLQTLPPSVSLIGISGVVNFLGAVWLMLFFLIDRRESFRRRFAVVLFISFMLFVPDTYKPEVSYLSHFVGYICGIIFAVVFYFVRRKQFQSAEVFETIEEVDLELTALPLQHDPHEKTIVH